jgi:hypothetical protein
VIRRLPARETWSRYHERLRRRRLPGVAARTRLKPIGGALCAAPTVTALGYFITSKHNDRAGKGSLVALRLVLAVLAVGAWLYSLGYGSRLRAEQPAPSGPGTVAITDC